MDRPSVPVAADVAARGVSGPRFGRAAEAEARRAARRAEAEADARLEVIVGEAEAAAAARHIELGYHSPGRRDAQGPPQLHSAL
jgi:hypothetical protein